MKIPPSTPRHATPQNARKIISGVGAVGIVFGAGAMAVGVAAPAHAATKSLAYSCKATVFGTTIDQGTWNAAVTVALPTQVNVGQAIPAPAVSATVTTSKDAADTLRNLGAKTVGGTSAAGYTVGPTARTADLTIPTTNVPASGPIVTAATGSGTAETAPATPTTLPVKVGDFTADLKTDTGFGIPVTCTLQAGQDATIGSIKVVDPATSTSTTTMTSTPPTSTTTTTSTPPTSTTTTTSTPPTSTTTTTSTPPTSTTTTTSTPPTSTSTTSSTTPSYVVPNVVGKTVQQAFDQLLPNFCAEADLGNGEGVGECYAEGGIPSRRVGTMSAHKLVDTRAVDDEEGFPDLTKYRVVSQTPAAGSTAAKGDFIQLVATPIGGSTATPTGGPTSSPATTVPSPITPTSVQTGSVGGSEGFGPLVAIGAGATALGVLALGGGMLTNRRRDEV